MSSQPEQDPRHAAGEPPPAGGRRPAPPIAQAAADYEVSPADHARYAAIARSEEFAELRRRFRGFVFPATAVFMAWYVLYVVCNNWFRDFMNTPVIGNVNVALIFGLLQFVSTFVIAALYARFANRRFDPIADDLRAKFDASRSEESLR